MQTSNQFPQEPEEPKAESGTEQVPQPLYEFSVPYASWPEERRDVVNNEKEGGGPTDTATSESSSETGGSHRPEEDLIRQGLVYPPPPSFYQQAQIVPDAPPSLPLAPPLMYPDMRGMGMQSPQPIGYSGMQPPVKKKSYKWLWITISILVVLVLASCGVCAWAFSQFLIPIVQSETDAINVTNEYYAALQNKDYAGAYQYLMPQGSIQGMTEETFTQRAQSADNQYGTVRSYTTGAVNSTTSSDTGLNFSHFTIVVNITRTGKSYDVLLSLAKSGNNWKIIDFDRI